MNAKLEKHVERWAKAQAKEYADGLHGVFADLFYGGGCASGFVSHLVYTEDATRFYRQHRKEIAELLAETLDGTGTKSPADLFNGWDKDDPLCLDNNNQTILAWFAFEETARRVAFHAGIEF